MKVLHVSDCIDPSVGGGTAERTFQLAMALQRAGEECTILCTDYGLGERRRAELKNINLIAVPTLFKRFLLPKLCFRKIQSLVRDTDLVHVTGHWSVLGAVVCFFALRLGKPYVYCSAGSLIIFGRSALLKKLYNFIIGVRIVKGASRCIAVTELECKQFVDYGIDRSKIVLLPNGIHPDHSLVPMPDNFRARYGLESNCILLFLGRLSPIKGPDLLLSAFAKISIMFPTCQLVFAGPDSELGPSLRSNTKANGLSHRVIFTGYLSGQDKEDALAAADLLVVPSRQEAMSLVALEAGLRGTPVLLTDQCGFDEVERVGGGLVVSVNDDALASGLQALLSDPELLARKGSNLREVVLKSYTWDGLTQNILQLYKELQSDNRSLDNRM